MKNLILFLILIYANAAQAQDDDAYVYAEVGVGGWSHKTFKLGLNVIFLEKHSAGLFLYSNWRDAHNLPDDFSPGFTFFFSDGEPNESLNFGAITYGRIFGDPHLRFNIKGGVLLGQYKHLENFVRKGYGSGARSHSYDIQKDFAAGILLNPTIEHAITAGWGMVFGPYAAITKNTTVYGIQLSTIFGSVRKSHRESYFE